MGTSESPGFNPHPSRRTGATNLFLSRTSGNTVSILTRPEGRVQLSLNIPTTAANRFQSSPVPKDGCNEVINQQLLPRLVFQSSPVPKDGCNSLQRHERGMGRVVSILTRPEGRVQLGRYRRWDAKELFQSSPVPKDGCNAYSSAWT